MKKMTLAQKKRRLKEIKADLAKHAKKPPLYIANDDADGFGIVPLPRPKMIVRPRVPADALPGEWVKLPPMKWPETLPVEVPISMSSGQPYISFSTLGFIGMSIQIGYGLFYEVLAERKGRKYWQSAWSETLVRLGYTEDA